MSPETAQWSLPALSQPGAPTINFLTHPAKPSLLWTSSLFCPQRLSISLSRPPVPWAAASSRNRPEHMKRQTRILPRPQAGVPSHSCPLWLSPTDSCEREQEDLGRVHRYSLKLGHKVDLHPEASRCIRVVVVDVVGVLECIPALACANSRSARLQSQKRHCLRSCWSLHWFMQA